jgi:hypothetical protein
MRTGKQIIGAVSYEQDDEEDARERTDAIEE